MAHVESSWFQAAAVARRYTIIWLQAGGWRSNLTESSSFVSSRSTLCVGIAEDLVVAGDMREAAEVNRVVKLCLAGRKALVTAGSDRESVADLDSEESWQEKAKYAGAGIPAPNGNGLPGIGASGPSELTAVIPTSYLRQRRVECRIARNQGDAAVLFKGREIDAASDITEKAYA